ncbi:MAG: hypothetical protein KatS3mg051_1163 [Anaerolineae bacterium]|nr:MAG: hypothetical protein KatS3mg051_1051 [Anaerolineae bacterium]GIV81809.1 MAG: hypothetical protein KatS3mg051_1163 [Anaerolineae bacterium]
MYLTTEDVCACAERYWRQFSSRTVRSTLEHFLDQLPTLADDATNRHVRAMADTIQRQDAEIQRLRRELGARWTVSDLRVRAARLIAEEELSKEEAGWLFEFLRRLEDSA